MITPESLERAREPEISQPDRDDAWTIWCITRNTNYGSAEARKEKIAQKLATIRAEVPTALLDSVRAEGKREGFAAGAKTQREADAAAIARTAPTLATHIRGLPLVEPPQDAT